MSSKTNIPIKYAFTAYCNLYSAVELVLTLIVTQVNCERAFSYWQAKKNKNSSTIFHKSRLSRCIYMLMFVEKDILILQKHKI